MDNERKVIDELKLLVKTNEQRAWLRDKELELDIDEIAVDVAEAIENGYGISKTLERIQKQFKLSDLQISNLEQLMSCFGDYAEEMEEKDWLLFREEVSDRIKTDIKIS